MKPPEDIRKPWCAVAHSQSGCALKGKACHPPFEAHHIIRRELHVAWMPENAILLCHHHHKLAHADRSYFLWALKGFCEWRWAWVENCKGDSPSWNEVRAELRKWTPQAASPVGEPEA